MLNDSELAELEDVARRCRRDIVRMTHKAGSGHPGGSLSAIDALVVLYLRHMRVRPEDPLWHERDMFFLSKGHCTPAYYAAMAARGYVPHEELLTFRATRPTPTCPASTPRPDRSDRGSRSPTGPRSRPGTRAWGRATTS